MGSSPLSFVCAAACLAAVAQSQARSETGLRFAWPEPSRARVTETATGGVHDVRLRYDLVLDRVAAAGLIVEFDNLEILEIDGREPSHPMFEAAAREVLPSVCLRPGLNLDAKGRPAGVVRFEKAVERALEMLQVADPGLDGDALLGAREQLLRGQSRAFAEARAQADWIAWVGTWVGIDAAKKHVVEDTELRFMSGRLPARMSTEVVPDSEAPAPLVHLRVTTTAGGDEACAALQAVYGTVVRRAAADLGADAEDIDAQVEKVEVEKFELNDRVEAVLDSRTLRPRWVSVRRARETGIKGKEPSRQVESRRFEFRWADGR